MNDWIEIIMNWMNVNECYLMIERIIEFKLILIELGWSIGADRWAD